MLRKMAKVRKKNTGFGETPLALVAKCYTDCAKHWMVCHVSFYIFNLTVTKNPKKVFKR